MEFLIKIRDFIVSFFNRCVSWVNPVKEKIFDLLYNNLNVTPFTALVENIIFYVMLALPLILFVLILVLIFRPKKRKYTFIVRNKKTVLKFKKYENIPYPNVDLADGEIMAGWFSDENYNDLFDLIKAKKRKLKLYAKIVNAESMLTGNSVASEHSPLEETGSKEVSGNLSTQEFCSECGAKLGVDAAFCFNCGAKVGVSADLTQVNESVAADDESITSQTVTAEIDAQSDEAKEELKTVTEFNESNYFANRVQSEPKPDYVLGGAVQETLSDRTNIVEEKLEIARPTLTLSEIYDEIRFELLSYERANTFNKLGTARKKFIAEMFEKNGVVYLYLAVDADVMLEKGYNIEKHSDPEFKIVPTKKVITGAKDYQEVMALVKETMDFNNLVKSDIIMATKTVSDETSRKKGFAFFVKNEAVATTADEYYKLLRANVLSYSVDKTKPFNEAYSGKMILKIFKKSEKIFVYLTLDAATENLEFVGYDKNFVDTPAMFEVATLDDLSKAYALIDKVMFRFGMKKHPENAELVLDETLKENCGFGYRIRN